MHAATLFAAVNEAIFSPILHAVPVVLAAAFVLLGLHGFRQQRSARRRQAMQFNLNINLGPGVSQSKRK